MTQNQFLSYYACSPAEEMSCSVYNNCFLSSQSTHPTIRTFLPSGCCFKSSSIVKHFPPESSILLRAEPVKSKAATLTLCSSLPDPKTFPGTRIVSFSAAIRFILLRFTSTRRLRELDNSVEADSHTGAPWLR